MAKFLVLYRSSASAADQMASGTPEQAQAGMDAWMAWAQRAGGALVDLGAPVMPRTDLDAGVSGADTRPVGGFSIVQADSPEALSGLFDGHPHLEAPDASIQVFELLPVPGTA